MAEEVGFEPTVDFHLRRFSRPVHSTTLPLLRLGSHYSAQSDSKSTYLEGNFADIAVDPFHATTVPLLCLKAHPKMACKYRVVEPKIGD